MIGASANSTSLVRGLGFWGALAVNVANMIGTGVFLKARVLSCNIEQPLLVLLTWACAGLLALLGAFAYAEISAMLPEAGGEYVFLRRAYGRWTGFAYGWTTFAIYKSGSQAALAVGFAIFLDIALGGRLSSDLLRIDIAGVGLHVSALSGVAVAAIWVVAAINCRSIGTAGRAAVLLTGAKVALLGALALGAFTFAGGDLAHLTQSSAGASCEGVEASARGGLAGFGAAMLGVLWAYDGWANVAPLAGEVRNPARNLPRAFFAGMLIVGSLYLCVNLGYFYVLGPAEISAVAPGSSVATEVLLRITGPAAVTIASLALAVSAFSSLQASALSGARIPFAMAAEGLMPQSLGRVSERSHAPVRAVLAQATWASVLALSGTYDSLTDSAVFAIWLFYGLTAGSLFVFRRTLPDAPRPYRAFGYPWAPAIFVAGSAVLLVNTFIATPRVAFASVGLMLAGIPFYWIWSGRHPARADASGSHPG